jgi:hypothetical protein
MRILCGIMAMACVMMAGSGCVSISLPETVSASLLPPDTSFIMKGQAEAVETPNTFPIWRGEDGQAFVLFQTANIKNDDFDTITTPGIPSRLQLSVRNDLAPLCQPDVTPVEIAEIFEINGVDTKAGGGGGGLFP